MAVSNDEIGAGGIHVYSLIQRHSCSNSIVLDVDGGVNARHTMDSGLLFSRIFGVLQNALRQTGEWLQKFLDLEDQRLPAFTDLIADMATRYGWTESQATTVAMGTEGKATTMGIINGITWMAHEDTQNATERLEVEKTAGNILMDPDNIMAWARKLAAVRERDELNEKQIDTKRAVERAFNR